MPVSISGTNGVTFPDSSLQGAAASPYVLKNRIINGDMRIDQRNAGASISTTGGFFVDRWVEYFSGGGVYSAQQSSTVPTGFSNSSVLTVTAADSSIAAGDYYMIRHNIEGYNVADLGWGTANASTVTLSFWVRSSITGTYGGSLTNSAETRSYPFTYTISVANTWEQKSITIAGDTAGTWLVTSGRGIGINFGLGMGSTYSGTAGSWASTVYLSSTGATNWISTNGATFYITGVQLEIGSTATPFERRLYNQELANCQRYYEPLVTVEGYELTSGKVGRMTYFYKVSKRATPTITLGSSSNGAVGNNGTELFNLTVTSGTAAPFTGSGGSIAIEL